MVTWFDAHRSTPLPHQLKLVRDANRVVPSNWARIDATDRIVALSDALMGTDQDSLRAGRFARLEAEISDDNTIVVRTQHVRRYTLFLNRELVDPSRPVTVLTNGHHAYHGLVPFDPETLLRHARLRKDPQLLFPGVLHVAVPEQ